MKKKNKIIALVTLLLVILIALVVYLYNHNVAVLNPAGTIGQHELWLIIFASLLSLIVVVPVFVLLAVISLKYRESNQKNVKYNPDFDHSRAIEAVWWIVPSAIILVLSIVTWRSSYQLNPYKTIASKKSPLSIEVVALDWKWLFIYPNQHVASVNFFEFPVNTPVSFNVTSDAPMNSFWIPQLGSQIYAMPGMSTKLNLMASKIGAYHGDSANISGIGFAGMNFIAKAATNSSYNHWMQQLEHSSKTLSLSAYNQLAKPSRNNPVAYYAHVQQGLYANIVMKYMNPNYGSNYAKYVKTYNNLPTVTKSNTSGAKQL